ncbi:hypothetical protein AN401_12240 [Zobellella denitrificans]|uniref:Lipoprotein n=1 Tax=Zobellella denitrificans TaxID=347534 RepID=A0A291HQM1_9GAMM|nr:hypothetical protein AN401_12240 [Zobellella denitrificans]
MDRFIFLVPALLGVALINGCATATPINTGGPRQAYYVDCSGGTMSSCIEKANSVCPRGYDIAGAQEQPEGRASVLYNPYYGVATSTQHMTRTMTVICK